MYLCRATWNNSTEYLVLEGEGMVVVTLSVGGADMERRKAAATLTVSLLVSLFIVCASIAWAWRIGRQSGRIYHELYHAHEALEMRKQSGSVWPGHAEVKN
jgi:hypothetical protein